MTTATPTAAEPATILLAEDDPALRALLAELLAEEGFSVLQTADGNAVPDLIRTHQPDLVVIDLRHPAEAGMELCESLRAEPDTRGTSVIVVSGSDERASGGADALLVKPFELETLLEHVWRAVNRKFAGATRG